MKETVMKQAEMLLAGFLLGLTLGPQHGGDMFL
jgi:hypothetical protein